MDVYALHHQRNLPAPDTVKKVFTILSTLEGKFDAINTYDAGYISAGFIQFISGKAGSGSLQKVLLDAGPKSRRSSLQIEAR